VLSSGVPAGLSSERWFSHRLGRAGALIPQHCPSAVGAAHFHLNLHQYSAVTFPGRACRTADPSAALGMTKGRVAFSLSVRWLVERTAGPSTSLRFDKSHKLLGRQRAGCRFNERRRTRSNIIYHNDHIGHYGLEVEMVMEVNVAPSRRSIEECIALLPEDSPPTIDENFARDVEEAVAAHREPMNPPASD
jgi:hypothetical protein